MFSNSNLPLIALAIALAMVLATTCIAIAKQSVIAQDSKTKQDYCESIGLIYFKPYRSKGACFDIVAIPADINSPN